MELQFVCFASFSVTRCKCNVSSIFLSFYKLFSLEIDVRIFGLGGLTSFCRSLELTDAKFGNPTTTLSGRTVMAVEIKRKEKKREKFR
jgi:hypothetical protein